MEQATGSPLSPASGRKTGREPLVVGCNTSVEDDVDNSSSVCRQLASMSSTLHSNHETVKKMDSRITSVEKHQMKLSHSINELNTLIKNNERSNFSIKGSTWEVGWETKL